MQEARAIEVTLLTQSGPKVLRSWSEEELKKLSEKHGSVSAQKLIIDESTKSLELNDRADIDVISIFGTGGTVRVPRFMVWRGSLKFQIEQGRLNSNGEPNRLLVPAEIFKIKDIKKIELSRASTLYPGTRLTIRTNPAASRGEKLYTQSCLACHSTGFAAALPANSLTNSTLENFSQEHKRWNLSLDPRALRGLVAYRDALASEQSQTKVK